MKIIGALVALCLFSFAHAKVLHVAVNNMTGGGEQHVLELYKKAHADELNHLIVIGKNSWLEQELTKLNLPYKTTKANHFLNSDRHKFHEILTKDLRRIIRQYKPTIIHSNLYVNLGAVKDAVKNLPVDIVYTKHSIKDVSIKDSCDRNLRGLAAAIGASPRAAAILHKVNTDHKLGIKKIVFVPPLFNENKFNTPAAPQALTNDTKNRVFTIVMIGYFAANFLVKNHPLLVSATGILRNRGYNVHVKFVSNGEAEDIVKELVQRLGLSDNISFLGYRTDVPEIIDAADTVVLAGEFDCFPLVLLEAGMRGKAAIGCAQSGASEIIIPYKTGLLFNAENASELADCIQYLITHPQERFAMGAAARERVMQHFLPSISYQSIKNIYLELERKRKK